MRDYAPEHFDAFAEFLFDNYAKKGLSVRQAVHEEMIRHTNLKYDEAYEEVVARLSEAFLRDAHLTQKSRELYNTDKTVWEKIRDALKDIVSRIEKYFANLSPDSDLGRIGAKMARENQEILDRFLAGVRAASENAAYIEKATGEGGVRFMSRAETFENKDSIRGQIYQNLDLLNSQTIVSTVTVPSEKMRKKQAKIWAKQLLHKKGYQVDRQNFGVIEFNEDDIENAFGYLNTPEEFAAIAALPNLLKRGLIIREKENHKGRQHKTITIAGRVSINGNVGVMGAVVKITSRNRYHTHRILMPDGSSFEFYDKNKTEATVGKMTAIKSGESLPITSVNPIIPDSSAKGNTSDKNNLGMKQSRDAGNVIPLSERFNSEESDIRYDSRGGDLFEDDDLFFGEDDDLSKLITRNYTTRSEAIGEVLKNTADIDIAPGKVYNIVARLVDGYNIERAGDQAAGGAGEREERRAAGYCEPDDRRGARRAG